MALKKIEIRIKKTEGGGLKKIDMGALKRRREATKALDFVGKEEDALAALPDDLPPEEEEAERLARLEAALNEKQSATDGSTIKADLKRQRDAHRNQGSVDYYRVICFADGDSATALLRKIGYPDPDARYIDGHILAGHLNIDLPKPKFRLQKIRPAQRTLERLVTAFPPKGGKQA